MKLHESGRQLEPYSMGAIDRTTPAGGFHHTASCNSVAFLYSFEMRVFPIYACAHQLCLACGSGPPE